jgi:uncharacterized Zn finger protein
MEINVKCPKCGKHNVFRQKGYPIKARKKTKNCTECGAIIVMEVRLKEISDEA